ncbi:MAG: FAD/NAD(P)-binding protein [Candidatus Omnitrophota bacterium]
MKKNIYQPLKAVIEEVIEETPTIKTFRLKPEGVFTFSTGQFIELTVPGAGEAPFTPSSDPGINGELELTIMNAGEVTSKLHSMRQGDVVGIRGPYGKGYPLDKFKGKDILIVGGGVGLAPLRSLLFSLFATIDKYNKVVLRYGSRSSKDIVYKSLIPEWSKKDKVDVLASVDVGDPQWQGNVGLVTTILGNAPVDFANTLGIVCGPPIMMKFVTLKLLDLGIKPEDIYLSMEKSMSCGLGKCGHCRIGKYYACKDGPVFAYGQLKDIHDIWD